MPGSPSLKVDVKPAGTIVVIHLEGELALINFNVLDQALAGSDVSGARALVIEAGALTFMDSSGLAALVRAHRSGAASGKPVTFAGFTGAPMRVLEVTRLNMVFSLHESEQDAVAAVSAQLRRR